MAQTIISDGIGALFLVIKGGRPQGEEALAELSSEENLAVTEFEKFREGRMFKQDRLMVFYVDAVRDRAIEGVSISEFFQIEFEESELPLLMLAVPSVS